jgi:hypothetical protein
MRRTARAATVLGGEVAYLLRDDYLTDRAAGAVHTTTAEPTGGARTVSDTNSKLTISGGALTFATGGASGGNPGLWYAQLSARTPGRFCVARQTNTGQGIAIGWDSNQSGTLLDAFRINSTTLGIVTNSSNLTVGASSLSVAYDTCVVLRATGAMYLIKGGAFTNWTLLFISHASNAQPYPGMGAIGTSSVGTVEYYRIPLATWMPTPITSDGFGSTFGTTDGLGHAETSGDGAGGSGKTWTQALGTWANTAGVSASSALATDIAVATVPTGTADCVIGAGLTRSAGNVGGVARYTNSSNYLRFYHEGTNAVLAQVLAGSASTLITGAAAYSAGARMVLWLSGTSARLYYNNAVVGSTTSIDAALTATNAGLYTTNTGNTFDNFTAYATGTGGEYNLLSGF